jgi:hypothetical protein
VGSSKPLSTPHTQAPLSSKLSCAFITTVVVLMSGERSGCTSKAIYGKERWNN